MWITQRESRSDTAALIAFGGCDMDNNLAYYRRRLAEERAAARDATHPVVRTAHRDLAREYEALIAAIEARPVSSPHVASAA